MKDKFIGIRLSREDYQMLKNDKRKTYNIFMTGLTLEKVEDRQEIIYQIKKIGNNINQIARKINENNDIEIEPIKNELAQIKELLNKI